MTAVVWFNGTLVTQMLSLDPTDRGLLLGDGLFETLAVFNRQPIWLDDHLERLAAGSALMGFDCDRSLIDGAIARVLAEASHPHGILRITLTRGPGVRGLAANGLRPSLLVTLSPWAPGTLFTPVKLVTSPIRRNETSPASRLKTLSYADNILAAREAAAAQGDDALFLNSKGEVASTTIANLFILRDGRLATPPDSAGILPGIARKKLLALAKGEERPIEPAELKLADAVILTNSLRLIRPVHALDGAPLKRDDVAVTRLFEQLCQVIVEVEGIDPRQADAL
jgi:branched-chain amino acid aminotransferase